MGAKAKGIKAAIDIVGEESYVFMFKVRGKLAAENQITKNRFEILMVYSEPAVCAFSP